MTANGKGQSSTVHRLRWWVWHGVVILIILGLVGAWIREELTPAGDADVYPSRPIEVVVPYGAGGGTDTLARLVQRSIDRENLLPQPLVIINRPGGSGTIGSRTVKNAKPDGYTIMCLDEGMLTAKISGIVPFGAEAFQPIAQSTENTTVVVVRGDSPFTSVGELLTEAATNPDSIRFGVPLGAPPHFFARELERAHAGAEFNYIQAAGAQKRYSLILGQHIDVAIFSLAEFEGYRAVSGTPPAQQLRSLAVLRTERHPSLPDTPTAFESGYEVTAGNALYWWAPKGISPERVATIAQAIGSAMATPTLQGEMRDLVIDPKFRSGPELITWLQTRTRTLAKVVFDPGVKLPDIPLYTGILVAVLGLGMVVFKGRQSAVVSGMRIPMTPTTDSGRRAARWCTVVVLTYGAVLAGGFVPYAVATAVMVFVVGGVIANWQRGVLPVLVELALLTGFGAEFVFTKLFSLVLP